jgi:hypothetical protein
MLRMKKIWIIKSTIVITERDFRRATRPNDNCDCRCSTNKKRIDSTKNHKLGRIFKKS